MVVKGRIQSVNQRHNLLMMYNSTQTALRRMMTSHCVVPLIIIIIIIIIIITAIIIIIMTSRRQTGLNTTPPLLIIIIIIIIFIIILSLSVITVQPRLLMTETVTMATVARMRITRRLNTRMFVTVTGHVSTLIGGNASRVTE